MVFVSLSGNYKIFLTHSTWHMCVKVHIQEIFQITYKNISHTCVCLIKPFSKIVWTSPCFHCGRVCFDFFEYVNVFLWIDRIASVVVVEKKKISPINISHTHILIIIKTGKSFQYSLLLLLLNVLKIKLHKMLKRRKTLLVASCETCARVCTVFISYNDKYTHKVTLNY